MREILDLFARERSVAMVADAAYRAGVSVAVTPPEIEALSPEYTLAGPVRTVEASNDLVAVIAAVHRAEPGDVVVIGNPDPDVGLLGDLIGTEARRKEIAGFVVDGCVRDRVELLRLGLPVFCRGTVPVGPLKVATERKGVGTLEVPVRVGQAEARPGDWAFGDADGVVFVAGGRLAEIATIARQGQEREGALTEAMARGEALGDLLEIDAFLERRDRDPGADFNAHLSRIGRAI